MLKVPYISCRKFEMLYIYIHILDIHIYAFILGADFLTEAVFVHPCLVEHILGI